jgi:hypothetical protein
MMLPVKGRDSSRVDSEGGEARQKMRLRGPLVVIVLLFMLADATSMTWHCPSFKKIQLPPAGIAALGCAELSLPFLGALIAGHKFRGSNLSSFFGESEPYYEDKLWHLIGAQTVVEFNYTLLKNHSTCTHPLLVASLLSLIYWTGVECRDGFIGSKFSFKDELFNGLGIALAAYEIQSGRRLPVKLRIGVRSWPQALSSMRKKDFIRTEVDQANFYRYMQADIVYCRQSWYAGVSLSRGHGPVKNAIGITIGFDIIDKVNGSTVGWWNAPLGFLKQHFNLLSVSTSTWIDK